MSGLRFERSDPEEPPASELLAEMRVELNDVYETFSRLDNPPLQPDELRGELVCAVVRRSPRHRDVTLDELCAFLDERGLMKQKWPERLVVVDEFPLTGLGKVAKSELAQQIAGGTR